MTDPERCPKCGAPLAAGSCPRCLLAAGLESGVPGGPPPSAPSPAEMQKHFPGLEVQELLGQGGMGIVYKARHKNLDRPVALKVLLPEIAREAGFAERFTREARTLARLQHPHIVGVHDFGESDGLWYLVMEFVDGTNLRQVMQAGGLGPKEALAIVPQVCDALQYAHDQGIVHRDIKPENILVDRAGRVKIADFGLAKLLQRAPVDLHITRTGQVMGTLHYMAPEQYRAPEGVDHRADIYSLGVVFYEMLTGELPLGSFPRPSSKAGVDARLDAVVMRAMERERDQRYQKASEVRTAVDSISSGGAAPAAAAVPAFPAPVPPPAPAVEARLSRMAVAGGLGVPASVLFAAIAYGIAEAFTHLEVEDVATVTAATFVGGFTLFAGFILSIVAWVRIARSGGRLRGLGWAITGTFLAPLFSCTGAPLFLLAAAGTGMSVHEGPDGTRVRMPFLSVEDGPGGTRVKMPGLEVNEGPEGTHVKMPGIDVKEGSGDTVLVRPYGKVLVRRAPEDWTTADREAVVLAAETHWAHSGQREVETMFGLNSGRPSGGFRLKTVSVRENGARVQAYWDDGKVPTPFLPFVPKNGMWVREGPADDAAFVPVVSGGPVGMTDIEKAAVLREVEALQRKGGLPRGFCGRPDSRVFCVWLSEDLRNGRVVIYSDVQKQTVTTGIHRPDGTWIHDNGGVEEAPVNRPPAPADLDGWLLK